MLTHDYMPNDAIWLSNLVENLLNIRRIQDGKLTVTKKNTLIKEAHGGKITVANNDIGGATFAVTLPM